MGLSPRHTKASEVFKLQVQDSQTARAGLIQTFSPTLTLKHLGISPGSHAPTWSSLSIQCLLLQLVPKPHSQFYQLLVLLPRADDIFHLSERILGREQRWWKISDPRRRGMLAFQICSFIKADRQWQSRRTMTVTNQAEWKRGGILEMRFLELENSKEWRGKKYSTMHF